MTQYTEGGHNDPLSANYAKPAPGGPRVPIPAQRMDRDRPTGAHKRPAQPETGAYRRPATPPAARWHPGPARDVEPFLTPDRDYLVAVDLGDGSYEYAVVSTIEGGNDLLLDADVWGYRYDDIAWYIPMAEIAPPPAARPDDGITMEN